MIVKHKTSRRFVSSSSRYLASACLAHVMTPTAGGRRLTGSGQQMVPGSPPSLHQRPAVATIQNRSSPPCHAVTRQQAAVSPRQDTLTRHNCPHVASSCRCPLLYLHFPSVFSLLTSPDQPRPGQTGLHSSEDRPSQNIINDAISTNIHNLQWVAQHTITMLANIFSSEIADQIFRTAQ